MVKVMLSDAIKGRLLFLENENTRSDYGNTYKHFLQHVGDQPVADITATDVAAFMAAMRDGAVSPVRGVAIGSSKPRRRRPKTLLNMHIALSSLWTWMLEQGHVTRHIVHQVPKPRHNPEPIQPLTVNQVIDLIRACDRSYPWRDKPLTATKRVTAIRDRALIALIVETALRVEEVCSLKFKHVEISAQGGELLVDLGKGKKSRIVPFQRRCAGMLHAYIISRSPIYEEDYLFVSTGRNEGLPMTRNGVRQMISKLGKKVGIRVNPQRLRVTAACLMVQNGMTAWELQRVMGHADVSTTMRYVRAAQIDLKKAMRQASPIERLRL